MLHDHTLTTFNILSLFYIFRDLIIMFRGYFLFWSSLYTVPYVSCTLIDIFFFRLGTFSSMILLKLFSESLTCFFLFSFSLILRLSFYLINVSISSIVSSVPEILSFIFCILLVKFVSVRPGQCPIFCISRLLSVWVDSFFIFQVLNGFILSFYSLFIEARHCKAYANSQ